MFADKRNASRISSGRSLEIATFHLTGRKLSHEAELPGDPPVPLYCHALTLNTIERQLSDAFADSSMLHLSVQFRIMFINAHFLADNASHSLASSATAKPTFNYEEDVAVIRNGWTQKKRRRINLIYFLYALMHLYERPSKINNKVKP